MEKITLHAFGDSFTYGHELRDCPTHNFPTPSKLTYSALLANDMEYEYQCHAMGGMSNNTILRQIKHASISRYDMCVVMWTFSIRHAFMFVGKSGWRTIQQDEHKWWWNTIDHTPEQCLDRTLDSMLAAQTILNSIGCMYIFLTNNIELQDYVEYNSKWLDKSKWCFLPEKHKMIYSHNGHPKEDVHHDVFQILKEKLNGI